MIAIASTLVALAPAPGPAAQEASIERVFVVMGTRLRVALEATDRAEALRASEAVLATVQETEADWTTWQPDSPISLWNASATPPPLAARTAAELERALAWARATNGAFDPTVGALVEAWDLRGTGRVPGASEIEEALARSGFERLTRTPAGDYRPTTPGLALAEGGFAKGAALDRALIAAREAGATGALLDFGGQIALLPSPTAVEFAIAHPGQRERQVLACSVRSGSIATSGNSERKQVVAGQSIGHILDPRSGRPAANFGSVSVWAHDGLTADCLSTALFVLGPSAGAAWVEQQAGVEAVYLTDRPGAGLQAWISSGLRQHVHSLDDDVELISDPRALSLSK